MKIEITGATAQELMDLFEKFPYGKIIVVNGEAFWETIRAPQEVRNVIPQQPRNTNQKTQGGIWSANRARDFLFNSIG